MPLSLDLPIPGQWPRVEAARRAVAHALRAALGDDEQSDALAMVAGELLENGVKYGGGAPMRLSLRERGGEVVIEVVSAVPPGSRDVDELERAVAAIAAAGSAAEAYEASLARLFEDASGPSRSRLGLTRIAYAGGCTLEIERAPGEVLVRARRAGGAVALDEEVLLLPGAQVATQGEAVIASPAMKDLFATLERVARSHLPVLLLGETGTGKEVVARAIHERGPRRAAVLRAVNCGALAPELVAATLFGHERGAFTGASRAAAGVFESASGSTVLLDEVGELPLPAQAALLRVLETQRVTRIGSNRELPVDVRVIAATHRDLEAMVAEGRFREDLYYRLNVLALRVLPLRERRQDIRPLASYFLRLATRRGDSAVRSIGAEAMALLERHPWPGNVRELRNAIERAVAVAPGETILPGDLPPSLSATPRQKSAAAPDEKPPLRDQLRRLEREQILQAIDDCDGNQTEAARRLGMPIRTLVHKLRTWKGSA